MQYTDYEIKIVIAKLVTRPDVLAVLTNKKKLPGLSPDDKAN